VDRRLLIGGAGILIIIIALFFILSNRQAETIAPVKISESAQQVYKRALALKEEGEFIEARYQYESILNDHPDFGEIETVQKELESLNMNLIFSNTPIPDKTVIHEVVTGDTLGELAKKYGTTIDLIKKSNGLTSNTIRVGQKLRIWTGTFNIFVDKSRNLLTLKEGDEILKVYNVSTGEGNITPVGEFVIKTKLIDPVWFNKGIVVPPESPQNVLGTRWLGFDLSGYGIHGTIEPASIGQQVTAGCIRMLNSDVEELFSIIPRGTKVLVVD